MAKGKFQEKQHTNSTTAAQQQQQDKTPIKVGDYVRIVNKTYKENDTWHEVVSVSHLYPKSATIDENGTQKKYLIEYLHKG